LKPVRERKCEADDGHRKLKNTFVIDSNKIAMLNY
jgi:hypothetical protein